MTFEECEFNIRRLAANIYDCEDCMDCSNEEIEAYWFELNEWRRRLKQLREQE